MATALTRLGPEDLRVRYDGAALAAAEIYPDIWDGADVFDTYLAPNFEILKGFYDHAAGQRHWVLQSIV